MRAELIRADADIKTSFKGNKKVTALAGRVLASANVKKKICRFMNTVVRSAAK